MGLITRASPFEVASESYCQRSGKLVILSTNITPLIVFEPNEALLEIRGQCIPSDCIDFFKPLLELLDHYTAGSCCSLIVNLRLECFSGSALKCLFEVLRKLEIIQERGCVIQINWYIEPGDHQFLEIGKDYGDLLSLEINFIDL